MLNEPHGQTGLCASSISLLCLLTSLPELPLFVELVATATTKTIFSAVVSTDRIL
jgi:hypothetical protein